MTTAVNVGCYVFAVVPAGTPVPPSDAGGLAAGLKLIEAGGLAAVVGQVPTDRPLGRAADLRAHDRVVAELVAAGSAVLPMRFGAVVADEDGVVDELLVPHRAEFEEALVALKGRVQYTVRVEYDEAKVLGELLAARPDLQRLRAGGPQDRARQLQLGELVVHALE